MDNAYMLFNQHRIPHSALLSRYASVNPETGNYSKPKNAASVYGSLTRVGIIAAMETSQETKLMTDCRVAPLSS